MRNPISATYQWLDDSLMAGANYSVRAYNWTFGGTKVELANHMLSTGVVVSSVSCMLREVVSGVLLDLPAFLLFGHIFQIANSKYGKCERNAIDKGFLDPVSEEYKNKTCRIMGPCVYMTVPIQYITPREYWDVGGNVADFGASLGFGIVGSSFYVMRADDLPPRKNVFSRLADRAVELYDEYRKPTLRPARVSN